MCLKETPNSTTLNPVKNWDIEFLKAFGENLKRLRVEKGLSQEQLANDADIPLQQVGRIERAEINTTLNTIKRLADALGINPKQLFK